MKGCKRLYSARAIAARVKKLGKAISADYAGKDPLFVCVLKGACIFFSDLVRAVSLPVQMDFVQAASYGGGTVSSGEVRIVKDVECSVAGRHVLLVEDIVDTGRTLARLQELFKARGARSVQICALLDKPSRRAAGGVRAAYCGFTVEDRFVVGYGLDLDEKYRNLPYIGELPPQGEEAWQ